MSAEDGGAIFPNYIGHPGCLENEGCRVERGMTLRDYFAAHAPIPRELMWYEGPGYLPEIDRVARAAYRWADAMLKARGG